MAFVFVGLAVCIKEYKEHGTADHDSYQDHVCDVYPMQKTHSLAGRSKGEVDEKIECGGGDQQQDAMPELSLRKIGLPFGAYESQIALAEPPVDALEYPVHADGNHHYADQCGSAVYCVSNIWVYPEVACHDVVQPFNYSSHNLSFIPTIPTSMQNKKPAPKPEPV